MSPKTEKLIETAKERMLDLLVVQNYDRFHNYEFLTFYDRIQICQLRSNLQCYINYLRKEIKKSKYKRYELSEDLELKITEIQKLIIQENYELQIEKDN